MPPPSLSSGLGKSHGATTAPLPSLNLLYTNSIESNIIIMASCIPTLGPVYEMLRGKRSWSSHQRYYKSTGAKLDSSLGRLPKRPVNYLLKENDLWTTTIETTKRGSQESILGSEEMRNRAHPMGNIQRTDQVTVEYETSSWGDHGETRL